MRLTGKEFRHLPSRAITLLGMSGVGKTRLASRLRHQDWFHYSGDYRIGTRYLGEPILDNIKRQLMTVPFVHDLLRSDSIYVENNISIDNLAPLSTFLGKLGDPEHGGLDLVEFKRRQRLHEQAEVAAMLDVPQFIERAQAIYGYQHFVNDAGGSLCELDDPRVMEVLAEHTLVIYIRASQADSQALVQRAVASPKPMFYREAFLDEQLAEYMGERQLEYVALIDPDDFVRWIFPRLFEARVPRYEAIAARYGYTLEAAQLAEVQSADDFVDLVADLLDRA
ncbi:MAG: ATPase [Pseudomonadota bacterium]